MDQRVSFITLAVADLDRTRAFYVDGLGWRPFMDVGVLRDNREGWGTQVQLGVAGSVFGNDHLALYIEHQSITRAGTSPLTEIGLRYRWLY